MSERKIEGPARLIQDNIDETALNYSYGVNSRRDGLTKQYGEEGVGWEIVRPEAKTPSDREQRRLGREIIKIVVTPDGDDHAEKIKVHHSEVPYTYDDAFDSEDDEIEEGDGGEE